MRKRYSGVLAVGCAVVIGAGLAGCGGSSNSSASGSGNTTTAAGSGASPSSTASSTGASSGTGATGTTKSDPPAGGAATKVAVTLGAPSEFKMNASPSTDSAGKITFTADNKGSIPHEMVVVKAPNGAAALKKPDGTANEAGSVGEISEFPAGQTKSVTLTLPKGKYVLLCNVPGHFAAGMYTDFTVQ